MSDLPIKKNVARTFYIPGLVSQADVKLFKVNPTISAGDFKYSLDGGAWTNLATLPDVYPASGTQVRLQMAQAEMNGNQINVRWIDAAGAEWCDGSLMILTASAQMAELSTLTAAQVWAVLLSGLTTVGSIGEKLKNWVLGTDDKVILSANAQTGVTIPTVTNLTNAGTVVINESDKADIAAEVWATPTRTVTSLSNTVILTQPISSGGGMELIYGDDYKNADGRALDWSSVVWPNLTGATVKLSVDGFTDIVGSVVTGSGTPGATQTIRVELTKTQSVYPLSFDFQIKAALVTSGNVVTLVRASGHCYKLGA